MSFNSQMRYDLLEKKKATIRREELNAQLQKFLDQGGQITKVTADMVSNRKQTWNQLTKWNLSGLKGA